jgi:hypothetical protein
MKRTLLLFLLVSGYISYAGLPPFRLFRTIAESAWDSDLIVIGSVENDFDGTFRIAEVLKGSEVKPGDSIYVGELKEFKDPQTRKFPKDDATLERLEYARGNRTLLFLKRKKAEKLSRTTYELENFIKGNLNVASLVWFKDGYGHFFSDRCGKMQIFALDGKKGIRFQIQKTLEYQNQYSEIMVGKSYTFSSAGVDFKKRAERLYLLLKSDIPDFLRETIYIEIPRCNVAGLPVLLNMLQDPFCIAKHPDILSSICHILYQHPIRERKYNQQFIGILCNVIDEEIAYWRKENNLENLKKELKDYSPKKLAEIANHLTRVFYLLDRITLYKIYDDNLILSVKKLLKFSERNPVLDKEQGFIKMSQQYLTAANKKQKKIKDRKDDF